MRISATHPDSAAAGTFVQLGSCDASALRSSGGALVRDCMMVVSGTRGSCMPAVDYITVQGFKSIASIEELPLRQINLLIGANGSGKSNFIEVFDFLHAIREGRLTGYVGAAGGAEKLLHFGSKKTKEIRIFVSFWKGVNGYAVRLSPTRDDALFPFHEEVSFRDRSRKFSQAYSERLPPRGAEAGISDEDAERTAKYVRNHLGSWRVYHFHDTSMSSPMRKIAAVDDNRFLRPDGSNLAAFLYRLRQRNEDIYRTIVRTIQQVAPFFDDFQLAPRDLNPDTIKLEWRHRESDQYFDASSLSDGTLRFIALSALFLQPAGYHPSIILVDEPELGMHPYAIEVLASLIKQAAVETQVIVSTQSSLLLDHFDPEDILVADRVKGATQITRLDAAPLADWLKEYSLGQLWEKNEIAGRPVPELR